MGFKTYLIHCYVPGSFSQKVYQFKGASMFFLKLKILCLILLILIGCGGDHKNQSSVVLSDRALLECLFEDFNEDELMNLVEFECSNIDLSTANISELKNLPKLEKIHLDNTNLNDLNDISSIEQITNLKIVNNFPKLESGRSKPLDISSITSLNKLQYLDLSYNYIPNLDAISSLVNLKSLTLNRINRGTRYKIDLSALSTLTELISLSMEENYVTIFSGNLSAFGDFGVPDAPVDLTALSNLTKLEHLDLSSSIFGGINFTGFPFFPKLLSLDLSRNGNERGKNGSNSDFGLINVASLNKLTTLTHLDLHSNSIEDISHLASLTDLTFLDLGYNYAYDDDTWIPFSGTKPIVGSIYNIEALSTLTKLTFLNLSRTNITNFSFLANLDNLSSLNIDTNYLRDEEIIGFPFVASLEELAMKENWLTSSDFLSEYHLKKLDLSKNCISDFSQVNADEFIKDSQRVISNCEALNSF